MTHSWLIQGCVPLTHRLLEVKHLYKKVENQIKMAKMVLMNEIDKRTNILLEQLEVSKASLFDALGNHTKLNLIPVPAGRI